MTTLVTMFSAGGGSWKTAKVVARDNPGARHLLYFTDTLYEDADAYRFLIEGAANVFGRRLNWVPAAEDFPDYRVDETVGLAAYSGNPTWRAFLAEIRSRAAEAIPELVWDVEGRDPIEVFRDERFLGNSSVDPCSKLLKRRVADRWRKNMFKPGEAIFYVGIGEHEAHRYDDGEGGGIGPRMAAEGWDYRAPLATATIENLQNPIMMMRRERIAPPRLYALGYMHNNCGGFCCKAGQAHYRNRLLTQPERYAYDAMWERLMREFLDADVSMLTDRAGDGEKKVLTLDVFAERIRAKPQMDLFYDNDSGCGCMGVA